MNSHAPHIDALRAAAVTEERARIRAILGCPEATDRYNLALALATETGMEVCAARELLAATPRERLPYSPFDDIPLPDSAGCN